MKIGILQVDSVRDEYQKEFGNYPDMFEQMLKQAALSILGKEISVINYDTEHGIYPSRIDECDGYVITGSKSSVYDDEPWIKDFRKYVVELHEAKAKLVGICFGHQMIALALGGHSEKSPAGWGVGVHSYDVLKDKDYMRPPLPSVSAIVSHQDQVSSLPVGAELLSGSEFCPNSMFQIDNHILAFQGHPEFSKNYSRTLMNLRREIIGEEVYSEGMQSLEKEIHGDIIAKWIIRFIEEEAD